MQLKTSDSKSILRITIALFLAQCFAAAAYSVTAVVNGLAFIDMVGDKRFAGVPLTLVLIGSAIANYKIGAYVVQHGRRAALVLGSALGLLGAAIGGTGIASTALAIYIPGMFLLGAGRGILDQSRYAVAEVYPAQQRARAISIVVWGSTIGSVLGSSPFIVVPFTEMAKSLGWVGYAGPLFATSLLYAVAAIVLFILLAVDFAGIAKRVAGSAPDKGNITNPINKTDTANTRSLRDVMRDPNALAAIAAMVCGHAAMVFAMNVIAIHMKDHGHPLGDISAVQTTHVLGMFALSPLVGIFGDKFGRKPIIVFGAMTLALGCLFAPLSQVTGLIAAAQFLVGFGWSCCYVSGSALLTDALGAGERARLQGKNEVLINVAAATGGLSSGFVLSYFGFTTVALLGFVVSVVPVLFIVQSRMRPNAPKKIGVAG